ncbi:hypothetical protein J1N35_010760 [Gossypium stocksii]|uniref:Uncharacterized protein n=1 Tax=Gossypium stocksii TaxID=47602 RepID=A0A9D4AAV2_9ROSI|nr:hypothetical protein J1N35_010760 [Gossypium stocksii]
MGRQRGNQTTSLLVVLDLVLAIVVYLPLAFFPAASAIPYTEYSCPPYTGYRRWIPRCQFGPKPGPRPIPRSPPPAQLCTPPPPVELSPPPPPNQELPPPSPPPHPKLPPPPPCCPCHHYRRGCRPCHHDDDDYLICHRKNITN